MILLGCLSLIFVSTGLLTLPLYPILWMCLGLFFGFASKPRRHVRFQHSCCLSFRCRGKLTLIRSVLLILSCRLGEAANPGPDVTEQSPSDFCIGSFNPSGLPNKAMVIQEHLCHGHLWLISETHLSDQAMHRFRQSLQCAQSPYKFCVGGHPVAKRHQSKLAGQWNGVAALAKVPTRAVPHQWSNQVHMSSRIQVVASLINDLWVTSGILYGETIGPTHPNHLGHNELLLKALVNQVCFQSTGPRIVAGDFNVEDGELPSFQTLRSAGFEDIQTIAHARWGIAPQCTCKLKTRKDFLFISSELQALLKTVVVTQDTWADHAVLEGHFRGSVTDVPRFVFQRPKPRQWPPDFDVSQISWPQHDLDPTARYQACWEVLEESANQQQPSACHSSHKGRGRPVQIKTVCGVAHSPIRVGRPTDVQPLFHGISIQHAQWFRQLRRLQAFVRLLKSSRIDQLGDRVLAAWNSILRGKGFHPSFQVWWQTSQFKVANSPVEVPWTPPDVACAQTIYESFNHAVRDLEKSLRKACTSYARSRRAEHPNVVFQDIRPVGAEGVNLLVRPITAKVLTIDPDEFLVTIDTTRRWDESKPLYGQGKAFQILHAEDDNLWLDSVEGLQPHVELSQVNLTGGTQELCDAFRATWRERWMRHADIPASQWNTIVDFARRYLPKAEIPYVPIDADAFQQELRFRRSKGATGLDGVSLNDLQQMPERAIHEFCTFFHRAESEGVWPQQLLSGLVHSLAKTAHPESPLDFRPITILPVLYRIWGSHHSKIVLRALDKVLTTDLRGSRPGCHATQVWTQLLWLIEQTHVCEGSLAGLQADIQKAFNHLPRLIVAEAAAVCGLPCPVILAWTAAVQGLQRFFQIRSSLSLPVGSVTGYPEGCAMSCVAMTLVDAIFHAWFQHSMPQITPISYVDDWQLLASQAVDIGPALRQLDTLCKHLDVLLDKRKTFAWALRPEDRLSLRQQGLPVALDGKILGAHAQFSLRSTNRHFQVRLNSMPDLFERLRASQSPYATKLKAICSAAWPKALHGCLAVHISSASFAQLRTAAVRALHADGSGVNPMIHLGMVEKPRCDPAFWTLTTSIRQIRDCGAPEVVESLLACTFAGDAICPKNGITSILLERLHWLGWHVDSAGWLRDHWGRFSLFDTCLEEVLFRATWAWHQVVSAQVSHRVGLGMLHLADVPATQAWLDMLSPIDKGLFRKILNGAIFTCNYQSKWDDSTTSECAFCACTDGRYHRWWICEYLEVHRSGISADVFNLLPFLPESLTCFGWALLPCTWHEWIGYLANIPQPQVPHDGPNRGAVVDVFTDGTCQWPAESKLRFAAWSAVAAFPDDHECGPVIFQGILPGILQSAYRAELFAVCCVLRWAALHQVGLRLWVDCASVVNRFQRLLNFTQEPSRNIPHADLWREIFQHIQTVKPFGIAITKVPAHVSRADCTDVFQEWCSVHNAHAHRSASVANHTRDPAFWELHHRHVQAVFAAQRLSRQIQQVQLEVSRALVAPESKSTDQEPAPPPPAVPIVPAQPWAPLPPGDVPEHLHHKYGRQMCEDVTSWIRSCTARANGPSWLSYYQLYIDFMGSFQCGGPILLEGCWYDPRKNPEVELVPYMFKQRCTWWARMFREILKSFGGPLITNFGRPNSHMLCVHAGCYWTPWPSDRLQTVEAWIANWLVHPATRNGDSLSKLPASKGPSDLTLQTMQQ